MAPVRRAACSSIPMVIAGETGTGKERLARAIHTWSGRGGNFVAINCAALPAPLVESELFGYRRGAFTGAGHASVGHFRAADGGTLLLDEIGDLPAAAQAKLLRVLEEGVVVALGSTQPVSVDVRVVAAAQQPLTRLVEKGAVRADLYARLAGLAVELPPLRERREDIVPLFLRFLVEHGSGGPSRIHARLAEDLCLYSWPHNVRELQLLARQLLALHGHEAELTVAHLPPELRRATFAAPASPRQRFLTRREHDLYRLALALEKSGGSVKAAALELGCSRARVYRLLGGRSAAELMAEHAADLSRPDGARR